MKKQICTRCVMDNIGDDTIKFENDGTCNYCNYALSRKDSVYYPNDEGKLKLQEMIKLIKEDGKNKEFDCLMGISGGLDSSYLALLGAQKWGLRILAVHIDDGFDTNIAKQNIKKLCDELNIKLVIERPDKSQYMDLVKGFIRAGVPAIDTPQDNVLLASLNKYSKKHKMKYFLSGANFSLESILQRGNGHYAADKVHILDIHRLYGEVAITTLPLISIFERYIGKKYISRIKTIRPLDFINYNKNKAINELQDKIGFKYYGGKHYESVFTRFVQNYYLPNKFRVDKRKSHLSSLIISDQMTREEALEELKKPMYKYHQMEEDINFILNEIGMSRSEFDKIMQEPGKSHLDYKVSKFTLFASVARRFRKILSN